MIAAEAFLNMINTDIKLAYDVETNGLRWSKCKTVGYSISDGKEAFYVPVRHGGTGNIDNPEEFEKNVEAAIKKRTKPLIGHNIKFDSHFSGNHGVDLGPNILDTMIEAALLDEYARSYSLDAVSNKYPDIPQKKGKELYAHIGRQFNLPPTRNKTMGEFWRLNGDDPIAVEYAAGDTLTTYHVHERNEPLIYGQNLDVVYNIECRLSHVLKKMERRGVLVDMEELERVKVRIEELRMEAYSLIPMSADFEPMNVRSPKDLEEYFMMHQISDFEYTDKGNKSFKKTFLEQHDIGKVILQARGLDHFKNSFLDPIDDYIVDSVIYTNFNQTQSEFGGTKSGRLSCTNPNMQQIPKRDEFLGRIFRKIFRARPGYVLVEFDYSQAEPRLFAHYSGEEILVKGYMSSPVIDMHSVAAQYMGIDRKKAKNLNLGLLYAMGISKLAISLGLSEDVTRDIYYRWKRTFPKGSELTKLAATVAEQRGYVKTILGRRARFPDARWSYRALNRIIQGGSADILKYKMVELDDWLVRDGLEDDIRMLLNIHDAILFEVRADRVDELAPKIKAVLENVQCEPFNLKVPFVADMLKGYDWAEASYGAH